MISVGTSLCTCGVCKTIFEREWDILDASSWDESMGEKTVYDCELEASCPKCGKHFVVKMEIYEYPVGILDEVQINTGRHDSESEESITEPTIEFYDL